MDGWSALADPTRRTILELVAVRPRAVRELADVLPITRPAVSQHLKLLKDAGLVVDQAQGTRRIYRANLEALAELRRQLDRFWDLSLTNLKRLAEEEGH
jgi:DNA-binding transcriptional ArsR family regulator